jgi:hypothetical protein
MSPAEKIPSVNRIGTLTANFMPYIWLSVRNDPGQKQNAPATYSPVAQTSLMDHLYAWSERGTTKGAAAFTSVISTPTSNQS